MEKTGMTNGWSPDQMLRQVWHEHDNTAGPFPKLYPASPFQGTSRNAEVLLFFLDHGAVYFLKGA